jgi:hypothetical protein
MLQPGREEPEAGQVRKLSFDPEKNATIFYYYFRFSKVGAGGRFVLVVVLEFYDCPPESPDGVAQTSKSSVSQVSKLAVRTALRARSICKRAILPPHPARLRSGSNQGQSQVSKLAGRTTLCDQPIWKSATQQVWKPALQGGAAALPTVLNQNQPSLSSDPPE